MVFLLSKTNFFTKIDKKSFGNIYFFIRENFNNK